jgi:hypothetical protein
MPSLGAMAAICGKSTTHIVLNTALALPTTATDNVTRIIAGAKVRSNAINIPVFDHGEQSRALLEVFAEVISFEGVEGAVD